MASIFVPAFNEARNLGSTVKSIIDAASAAGNMEIEIIIVNDGSTDETESVTEGLKKKYPFIRSIRHEKNRGLGAGFKAALAAARHERFLVVPGDNDLASSSIQSLFAHCGKAEAVFLFFLNNEIRGRRRHMISNFFTLIYMATFGIFVQYLNSPCIYATERLRRLKIRSSRFSVLAEVNTKLLCQGITFCEVAGYRQNSLAGSTSLSFKNFIEVVVTYLKLVGEIKMFNRQEFSQKPIRVNL